MTAFKVASALFVASVAAQAADPTAADLRFEQNMGQTSPGVSFLARWSGNALFLTAAGATLRTGDSVWKMDLVGANGDAEVAGLNPSPAQSHYLIGAPENWHTGIPAYGRVEYRNVYPGVNLVYYGTRGRMQYDLVVNPGAEPSQIRLRFEGAKSMQLDNNGDLVLLSSKGEWRHTSPEVYQLRNGKRQKVTGQITTSGADEAAIAVAGYDRLRPLVMTFSTYLGGSGQDTATSLAVDAAGNCYAAGWTESTDFPEAAGTRMGSPNGVDAYITKLSPAGQLLYVTYLGGSSDDRAYGIAVDSSGSAVVAGWTYSTNFPIVNATQSQFGGGRDAFVTKLNAAGNGLAFSTYWGGSGLDSGNAVAMDGQGNIYVAGETTSANFPVVSGFQAKIGGGDDAFIAKFSSAGARVYSTFLGGLGDDRATAIAVDGSGYAYITGSTYSPNFPVASAFQAALGGGQDAFAAKIGLAGNALVYSTYLGGSGGTTSAPETGSGIAVDSSGSAYISGATSSANFPVVNPLQSALNGSEDAFVLKLSASGGALVYSTYLGGSSIDLGTAIAIDSTGAAYVAGYTASTDFPVASAVQSALAGSYDAFVAKLNPSGASLSMGTYLGGSDTDAADAVALDNLGSLYVAGQTQSMDFRTVAALESYKPAVSSGFLVKLPSGSVVNPVLTSPAAGTTLITTTPVTFTWNAVSGATDYRIDVGTSAGGSDVYSGYTGGVSSITLSLSTVPSGHTVYIELYSKYPNISIVTGTGNQYSFATVQPDFSVAVSSSQTVAAGGNAAYTVTTTAINGFSGTVTFAASGLPAGASASFVPTSVNGSGSTGMTVSTSSSTAAGTYSLTITATSGTLSHTATATLAVTATQVDLAVGKTATQSSTLTGVTVSVVAANAVDGNTDGIFSDGSVSHTNQAANAWWQVDLGSSATVSSIAIWNRTDCCSNRLADYWVFVSDTPFASTDTPTTLQSRASTWSSHQTTIPSPCTTITVGAQSRYVRVQLSGSNYLSLAEVQVFGVWVTSPPIQTDLAVGKTATQSSTLTGVTVSVAAANAVDGNTDGVFSDGSVSHTNQAANAWWQVDLGSSATISSIAIWNRTDCCSNRLADYWVFVSDTPFVSTDTPTTLQSRANTWSIHQTTIPSPSSTITVGAQGRYVRVQLSGMDYLSLAEVQVFGAWVTSPSPTNMAAGKTATQSSTLTGVTVSVVAANAVDGNTDGIFSDGSVSHTNQAANAWWQVDLGSSATISSIAIWNRTDCCSNRLADYWVFVSNTPFASTDTPTTLQSRANTWSIHQTTIPSPSSTITVGAQGRYVRVQLSGTDYLSLAEVQVFGN